jgi:4-hydroxythreonine-4-phosphate dehydrogenase
MIRPLAISMGDPAGIGPEIIAKAWAARRQTGLPPFLAVGDARAIERVWNGPIARVSDMADAVATFDEALPILPVSPMSRVHGARYTRWSWR